jgi:carbon monoxide dehydrogenase subunit G
MRLLTYALIFMSFSLAAPLIAQPLVESADIKSHLWEWEDRDKLATSLPEQRLLTRTYKHDSTHIVGGLVIGLIKAPIDKVVPIVSDYASFKDMLPFFTQSTILGSGDNRTIVHIKVEIVKGVVKLWGNLEFLDTTEKNDTRVFSGSMVKGNMKVFEVRFELASANDGKETLILVHLLVDPDLKIAKDSKVNKYNQVNARRFIRAVKERAAK